MLSEENVTEGGPAQEGALDPGWERQMMEGFSQDRASRIARNAVTSSNVMAAARDVRVMRTYRDTFGVVVPKTATITNQRQSGRCWLYSAYNVARHATMGFLDVESFEFSQAFGMFYDKLEKANATLERVIATADLPWDSREVCLILEEGTDDGGYHCFAQNLIAKWGLVPSSVMPETACSKNSSQMNAQLGRLVRRDAFILRTMHEDGAGAEELRARKHGMMAEVYRLLAICLGEPPRTFDFVYEVGKDCKAPADRIFPLEAGKTDGDGAPADGEGDAPADTAEKPAAKAGDDDKKRRILRDCNITPREFARRYVPQDPKGFVSLVSMPGASRPFGRAYHLTLTDSVVGGAPNRMLNVEPQVLEQAAIASLRAGVPVAMACDVMQEYPYDIGDFGNVLSTDGLDLEGLFGMDLAMSRANMIDARETTLTHAMTFQGVELDQDGRARAWRVENSWGKDRGKDGYLVMSAPWFELYGGEVDVRREFVPDEVLALWDGAPATNVAPWSAIGRAMGHQR